MPISAIPRANNNLGKSFMHNAKCLNCNHEFEIPINQSLKYLAECPSCKTLFLRTNMTFDSQSDSDEETESFKLLESLYPTVPNNLVDDLDDAAPATEAEKKLLQDLNIKAVNPTSRAVKRLVKTIFEKVNVLVQTHFNPVLYFPDKLRNEIMMKVAQSGLFRDLYFDRKFDQAKLGGIIKGAVDNEDYFKFLNLEVEMESFEIAIVYISHYARVIYERGVSPEEAKMFAIQAFARGFGQNIHKIGYLIYNHEEKRVKNITRLSTPAMKSFYTRRNPVTTALSELLEQHGFTKPGGGGCMGMLLMGAAVLVAGVTCVYKSTMC